MSNYIFIYFDYSLTHLTFGFIFDQKVENLPSIVKINKIIV